MSDKKRGSQNSGAKIKQYIVSSVRQESLVRDNHLLDIEYIVREIRCGQN